MPKKCISPILYSESGVDRDKYFLNFTQKHRLWELVRTASTCNHNQYIEQKCKKKKKNNNNKATQISVYYMGNVSKC